MWSNAAMWAFCNTGWPYYEKYLSIMFSSAAQGSYVFHLTATTAVAPEEAKDDSSTAINPPLPPTSASFSVTAMDVNTSNHPLPLSSIKWPYSPAISKSDKVSLAILTAFSPPDIISIITTISTSEQPAKKWSRSSRYSGVSVKDIVFPAGKTMPASAVIGMQGSINQLTDIFERSMMSHLAEDPATTSWSCMMALVQEYDDDLTVDEKIALISYFAKDIVAANTYISLTDHEVQKGWIHTILQGWYFFCMLYLFYHGCCLLYVKYVCIFLFIDIHVCFSLFRKVWFFHWQPSPCQ